MTIHTVHLNEVGHNRVRSEGAAVLIGSLHIKPNDRLQFDDSVVQADALIKAARQRETLTQNTCQPQLAAYLFALTRQPHLMNPYFPVTNTLTIDEEAQFHDLINRIAHHPSFAIRLIDARRTDRSADLPPDTEYMVAGFVAEIFFYRQDLLGSFLSRRRGFLIYTSPQAFKDDGGVAGGCYNPQRDAIQLLISRLYEGFYTPMPGAAPFIHEFGHMLDHASGGRGLIPGMEGVIDLFRRGKQLELDRYERLRIGRGDTLPIGHPYVFQNDGEFIAGYLEMFFRNPNYFAAQNPDLYQAFEECLKQDPRRYWKEDFPYYVQQNRDYYLKSLQRPPKPGLTIP